MRRLLFCLLLLGSSAQASRLTVFAASSLTDAFTELGRAFDARTGHQTRFNFAGSQLLGLQLRQGAKADVFASANKAQYAPLQAAGRVDKGQTFVRNRLVVITPSYSQVKTLRDLAKPKLKLVLASPSVPAGAATRASLKALEGSGNYGPSFAQRVLSNVVSQETNVRQVALKVSLGQADAAFVYRSDVTPQLAQRVRVLEVPPRFNPVTTYPIGVVKGGQEQAARQFVRFVQSPEGQRILRKWGFLGAS